MSMDDVEKAWKCGRTSASRIKPDGDGTLSALATYLFKRSGRKQTVVQLLESEKTIRKQELYSV